MEPRPAMTALVDFQSGLGPRPDIGTWLEDVGAYEGYTYGYPHKTAYRPLASPKPLREVWSEEPVEALFLYLHVPFCEMRCGFCNLFTRALPEGSMEERYLSALERQAAVVKESLGSDAAFARVAFGGGTPTFLEQSLFVRMLDLIEGGLGASLRELPVSLETSPDTATEEKLREAKARGIDRVSIGVQSFFDEELKALGRPTRAEAALAALDRIRSFGFPTLNVDLIYGVPGQTQRSWLDSLEIALERRPEQLYLYPLYVRPLTGLGRRAQRASDTRPELYRVARDRLLSSGYEQVSMRMFQKVDAPVLEGPPYRCQEDGMVGLGCGARSYTRALHYSDEWAVSRLGVRQIIEEWIGRPDDALDRVWHGYELSVHEQKTRYLLQGLLQVSGLSRSEYTARFGSDVCDDRPDLFELVERELAVVEPEAVRLTAEGLSMSDAIGPWLYTDEVRARMQEYTVR